jgi:hypothetical protein
VQLLLTPSQPLGISISHGFGEVSAVVQSISSVHQPLYANAVSSCDADGGISYNLGGWGRRSGHMLHPDCAEPTFWYGVIGYLGQAVGTIDYVRPKG